MSIRTSTCGLAVLLLAIGVEIPTPAQTLYGSLTGIVSDASSAAVPNVRVEALNVGTGIRKSAQTDERGAYSFNDLQVGTYKVTFTAPAFSTQRVPPQLPLVDWHG